MGKLASLSNGFYQNILYFYNMQHFCFIQNNPSIDKQKV